MWYLSGAIMGDFFFLLCTCLYFLKKPFFTENITFMIRESSQCLQKNHWYMTWLFMSTVSTFLDYVLVNCKEIQRASRFKIHRQIIQVCVTEMTLETVGYVLSSCGRSVLGEKTIAKAEILVSRLLLTIFWFGSKTKRLQETFWLDCGVWRRQLRGCPDAR